MLLLTALYYAIVSSVNYIIVTFPDITSHLYPLVLIIVYSPCYFFFLFSYRDDKRRQSAEQIRTRDFLRHQAEAHSTENYLNMKAGSDQLQASRKDIELQILSLQVSLKY